MSEIVAVHGIAQQQVGRRQLVQVWRPALADGIELAAARAVKDVGLNVAFYGHLFLPPGTPGEMSANDGQLGEWDALDSGEVADLVAAIEQALTAEEIAAAHGLPPTMGYTRTPKPLQALLRGLDAKFGAAAGVLYLGTLRQVRRYLRDKQLRGQVDKIVADTIHAAQCRILVGHSLGSVVALEFVRQHPNHPLDLLLTLGSPLGLQMVQAQLVKTLVGSTTKSGIPENVASWVNVRDPRDPVTCAGDLRRWWPGSTDQPVDNQGDAHNVARYLSKQQTGTAILSAAPPVRWEQPR